MKPLIAAAVICLAGTLVACAPGASDYEVCTSYGLSPGQDGQFGQCMGERQNSRMQAAQILLNRPQTQPYQLPFYPISMQAPVMTNCTRMGMMTSCSSR
jgi:hypothetical protein